VLVIADEALRAPAGDCIRAALSAQDAWSAVPVIVLTRTMSRSSQRLLGDYETYGHVTLVERPVKMAAFIGTMKMALNERRHQQRIRGLLAEREQRAFIAELAGATAHELNQPLTAVMGYASLVQRQVQDDARVGHALEAIVAETERMAEIVRKLGRLTKHASKNYIGETRIVDIEASVDSDRSPDSEEER